MGQARKDILNGWKEIATYAGRDIRTVERWEKQRGLPIRRLPGAGRATVYALVDELDPWFASDGSGQEQDQGEDAKGASPEMPRPAVRLIFRAVLLELGPQPVKRKYCPPVTCDLPDFQEILSVNDAKQVT